MLDTNKQRKEIIHEIEKAFSGIDYPGDERLVTNIEHYEADEIIEDFKGKSWKEIPLKLVYKHRLSIPLFTPEAFRFFLPGLLIAALKAPVGSEYNPGEILEFIFYNLVPVSDEIHETTMLSDRINGFTPQQKASVGRFVWLFIESSPHHNELYKNKVSKFWPVS